MSGRRRRGLSVGSVLALALTALVVAGVAVILPRLTGDVRLQGTQGAIVLTADGIPVMEIRDIPLQAAETDAAPEATPAPAAPTQVSAAASATPGRTPRPVVTATPSRDRRVTLALAGTVALETNLRQSGYYEEARTYDFSEILAPLREEMQADLSLVTLENLVSESRKVSALVAPAQVMGLLKAAGLTHAALGFPKAYQYGAEAVNETLSAAREAGLRTVGLYAAEADDPPAIFDLGGVQTALLHYTDSIDKTGKNQLKKTGADWALPLTDRAAEDIRKAREEGAELVIVSLRWGASGKSAPTDAQRQLAQTLADAGADIIVGAGARRIQEIAYLEAVDGRRTLCAYCLGSLLEDSRDSGAVEGLILRVSLSVTPEGAVSFAAEAVPTFTWRFRQEGGYRFRAIPADASAPDGMDSSAQTAMGKALERVKKALKDSAVSLR